MFHHARLKLTAWYVLLALIITVLFSLLAYNGFRFEVERGLQRQRVIIQENEAPGQPPNVIFQRINPSLQEEIRERLLLRILYIDAAIIIVAAMGGYLLAGRTLKPIQTMVDEQNRFITDASHELRTPLTALRSELEATLLSKELSAKEAKDILKSNLEEVINLQILSDNLLELAAYKKLQPRIEFQNVSLLQVSEDAIKKVMPLAKKKHITINNLISDVTMKGERGYLVELFVILIDNAVKYSPASTVVKLSSIVKDKTVSIHVADQGIGIAEDDQSKIFDRFFRTDKSRTKSQTKGYGLGLAIAKQIAEDHKGTIQVKSNGRQGTIFSVHLPIAS